jgi:hypothetical protein
MRMNLFVARGDGVGRRHLFATVTGGVVLTSAAASAQQPAGPANPVPRDPRAPLTCSLAVNKQRHRLAIDPRVTLLDALREHLGLTDAKKGCDHPDRFCRRSAVSTKATRRPTPTFANT